VSHDDVSLKLRKTKCCGASNRKKSKISSAALLD
jgi:hypothetical protein